MTGLMKKILAILAAAALGITDVSAETVTRKEALRIARMFFNEAHHQVMGEPKLIYTGKKLTTDRLFNPFYVFNLPKGGFVIVSGENKAYPILGYSLKSNFDPEKMTPGEKALLRGYALDIERIRYDSEVPYEAIEAWQNLPRYIAGVLDARSLNNDIVISEQDAKEISSNIVTTGRDEDLASDLYTPSQWQELIAAEYQRSGNVVMGFVDGLSLQPGVIHGKTGDYFRISFGEPADRLMRLNATEILSGGQVAELEHYPEVEMQEEDESPFELHESFLAETRAAQESREREYERRLHPDEPVLSSLGAGHFRIYSPSDIKAVRIYNLQGSMVIRQTYGHSDTAWLDLSALPSGFYFAGVECDNGAYHGFKLWR